MKLFVFCHVAAQPMTLCIQLWQCRARKVAKSFLKMCEERECCLLPYVDLHSEAIPKKERSRPGFLETRMLTYTKVELVYQSGAGLGLGSH